MFTFPAASQFLINTSDIFIYQVIALLLGNWMENAQYLLTISDKNVLSISPCFLLARSFFSWNFFFSHSQYTTSLDTCLGLYRKVLDSLRKVLLRKGYRWNLGTGIVFSRGFLILFQHGPEAILYLFVAVSRIIKTFQMHFPECISK